MDTSTWVTLIAVVFGSGGLSAFGGYLLSGRNEQKRDDRAAARDRELLREKQADESRVFQRETLLELHDLLYKLNRNSGAAQHLDEMEYRKTGKFRRQFLPEDISDGFTELLTTISRLRVRIFDPKLRDQIQKYTDTVIAQGRCSGTRKDGDDVEQHKRAERIEHDLLKQYAPLEEALGVAIRSQFPGSDVAASLPSWNAEAGRVPSIDRQQIQSVIEEGVEGTDSIFGLDDES